MSGRSHTTGSVNASAHKRSDDRDACSHFSRGATAIAPDRRPVAPPTDFNRYSVLVDSKSLSCEVNGTMGIRRNGILMLSS